MVLSEMLKVCALVVTYKRFDSLLETINAIKNQHIEEEDIFVIDNDFKNSIREKLLLLHPGIQYELQHENIASAGGFAKGMWLAAEQKYDYVWLFNDDSRPLDGVLDSVADKLAYGKDHKLGLLKIGERVKEKQSVLLQWKGVRKPEFVPINNWLYPSDLITFDGCFINCRMIREIGTCDPLYFMGTYEFDYCLKVKEAGYSIYTVPNGLIADKKMGAVNGTPPWRQYYNTRNHLRLALHRRSFYIFQAWLIRELKYTYAILRFGNKKGERLLYKYRAIRDAFLNRRGKTYHPDNK
jgi:GT2 family glycosyltransferase